MDVYKFNYMYILIKLKVPWFCSTNLLEKIIRDEELKR